ncbi:hypothetical protein BHYA_0027g00010 [Botrytis hyacinthi]|uniref:Uncharacterized protein n=1 Tax=Botrytis hyacinthi TaxID=278943 RepID=A0A4Z1GWN5_9HELO|nr:hypothetical protein BHYA_0027g00010 [Botrytis hyacinthi]
MRELTKVRHFSHCSMILIRQDEGVNVLRNIKLNERMNVLFRIKERYLKRVVLGKLSSLALWWGTDQ